MYHSESWVWQKKNESRINAAEMCNIYGMPLKGGCKKSDVRERVDLKQFVVTRAEKELLKTSKAMLRLLASPEEQMRCAANTLRNRDKLAAGAANTEKYEYIGEHVHRWPHS
ncbi:hypothetical protein EVAR_70974_1 [Eumeta japonica]|uniref:Uncharacterized protein n=1 Tax=Eumeta variegata TaxID=151549 RepID=A0A4C2A482_EUMVA|nr:hypothetical protein EVAR_70974_1 [Eumeta japonica]